MAVTVFVSSSTSDLGDLRDELYRLLKSARHRPWMFDQDDWPKPSETLFEQCLINAIKAEHFVLILDREAGQYNKQIGTYVTQREYWERVDHNPQNLHIFVRAATWSQWEIWHKAPSDNMRLDLAQEHPDFQDKQPLFDFMDQVFGNLLSAPHQVPFATVHDIWEDLKWRLSSLPPDVLPVAEEPEHGPAEEAPTEEVAGAETTTVSITITFENAVQRTQFCNQEWLGAARRARTLATTPPTPFPDKAETARTLMKRGPAAFWFVMSLDSNAWLQAMPEPFKFAAKQGDDVLRWAIGRSLQRIAEQWPDAVLGSSVVTSLSRSGTGQGKLAAIWIIEAAEGWQHEPAVRVLESLEASESETILDAAIALADYAKSSTDAARVALEWMARWLEVLSQRPSSDRRPSSSVELSYPISEIISAAPAAALDHALALIEAECTDTNQTRLLFELSNRTGRPLESRPAVIQVRELLASRLRDASLQQKVLRLLSELLTSDVILKRALAMDVAQEDVEVTKGLVLKAIQDQRNYIAPLSKWTDYLISKVFPLLDQNERADVTAAVLALPDETTDEIRWAAIKFYALDAIPDACASLEVKNAVSDLQADNPQFAPSGTEPEAPSRLFEFVPRPTEPALNFSELIASPAKLIASLQQIEQNADIEEWYAITAPLADALKEAPETILDVAKAVAKAQPPLNRSAVEGVARAARESDEIRPNEVVRVARALEPVATADAHKDLSDAISKRWAGLDPGSKEVALELFTAWSDPERESDPTVVRPEDATTKESTGDAATIGLNSARGSVAVALVEIVAQGQDEFSDRALELLMTLTSDPAPPVRAVLLLWLHNVVGRLDREWLVSAARECISDFDEEVLPHAGRVFRVLNKDEVQGFGFEVARAMIAAGGEVAGAGGYLAGLWSLRFEIDEVEEMVADLIDGDSIPAKTEAARVFGYNLDDQTESVRKKCTQRCKQLLEGQPPEVRAAVAHSIPTGEGVIASEEALEIIRLTAADEDSEVVGGLRSILFNNVKAQENSDADAVAAVILGLLENENEQTRERFLHDNAHMLEKTYRLLTDADYERLPLALLDAACYHRVGAAQALLGGLTPDE